MPSKQKKMYPYSKHHFNKTRIEELALPKERSDKFIPDRPSAYWTDYIIDPIPQTLKGSQALMQYYKKLQNNMPRLSDLARPKTGGAASCLDSKSKSNSSGSGVAISALTYEPSERIKQLAQPKPFGTGDKFPHPLPDRKASNSSRTRLRSPTSRHPRYPWKKESTDSTKVDLGKGDFPNRSKYHIAANSTSAVRASISLIKTEPQVHVQSRVSFMHQKLVPPPIPHSINNKPQKTYAHSTTAVGSFVPVDRLLIDRSYTASRINIDTKRAETADNNKPNVNTVNRTPRFIRNNPLSMKYAPTHGGCQTQDHKKPPL